jgi:uncharacterized protein YbaA (DUF1428 family)
MAYIDGFVLPCPKSKLAAYRKMAAACGKIWKKHGALEFRESVADDLRTKGCFVSFASLAKAKKSETVLFSFIVFRNRAHRDQVNRKVMADPAIDRMMKNTPMPFDMKRMAYAGFKTIVDM